MLLIIASTPYHVLHLRPTVHIAMGSYKLDMDVTRINLGGSAVKKSLDPHILLSILPSYLGQMVKMSKSAGEISENT